MDIGIIIGIVGILLAIVGILFTIYGIRKSKQEKKLVYEVSAPVPVADVLPGKSAYSLKVVYEKPDATPAYIDHAFTQFLRFSNIGQLPINKTDLAEIDSLRIEILEGHVLAASLLSQTKNACNISLRPIETDVNEDITTIRLGFNFLDYMDGGIIQILTGREHFRTTLKGTIIGMPRGIEKIVIPEATLLPNWGWIIIIISFLLSLGATFVAYKIITGIWTNSWILLLPLISLTIPIGCLFLLYSILNSKMKFDFPKQLSLPNWYLLKQFASSSVVWILKKPIKK